MIPQWVNVVAGIACLLLSLNFFRAAATPSVWLETTDDYIKVMGRKSDGKIVTVIHATTKPLEKMNWHSQGSLPEEFRYLKDEMNFPR